MAVTAPETVARQRLIALLEAEFGGDGVTVKSDKLNESLAQDGHLAGVYPATATENQRQAIELDTVVYVQLFRQWNNLIDATQEVDPADIEEWAERFRRACQGDLGTVGDQHVWYFNVQRIEYPPDPSGNISRLLATVVVTGENSALLETSG
jgi:hypothetical protein